MDLRQQGPGNGREPCPDRLVDDVGLSFAVGVIGGGAWHFLQGLKGSPRGSRLVHAAQVVRMSAPRTAGNFAVWGGVFAAAECGLFYSRQKEDPWNSIISGAVTGGFLQMRQGFWSASRSALLGGALVALVEGLYITCTKLATHLPAEPPEWRQATISRDDPYAIPMGLGMGRPSGIRVPENSWIPLEDDAAASSSSSSSSSSWLGSWFGPSGGKREETEKKSTAGVMKKTKFLEDFSDAPMPPTSEFK